MAKLCEHVDESTNQCTEWVDHSYLPELSTADMDAMLYFFLSIMVVVFVVNRIRSMLGS